MKLSRLKAQNKPVKVIVTSFFATSENTPLIKNMKSRVTNIEEVSVQKVTNLCEDLFIDYDWKNPKDLINKIIRSLNTNSDQHYVFVCDEVVACRSDGQITANWADLATAENVTWVLAIRPDSDTNDIKNLTPPSGSSIISRKLLHSHRNSYQIRSVIY